MKYKNIGEDMALFLTNKPSLNILAANMDTIYRIFGVNLIFIFRMHTKIENEVKKLHIS